MKKVFYSLFFAFFVFNYSLAQKKVHHEFYSYLVHTLENTKIKSIELQINNYGCLGSQIYSETKLVKKDNSIEIQSFSYNPKDINHLDLLEKKLDTTFTISKNNLIKKFNDEIVTIDSRIIFLESNYRINVATGNLMKQFQLTRAEGLYYLLRYNKSPEIYFKDQNSKEIK